MNWKEEYERWANNPMIDIEVKDQLSCIHQDEGLVEDCFYKTLEFGTGGLRGELGPGPNRLNVYTIRKATEGLAQYISQLGESVRNRGVAIAYDSRHKSPEFALETAKVLAQHGIQVYLFEELQPTPILSFAVRYLKATAGIVITASHNPPEYNGYKVYGSDGGQITLEVANEIINNINSVEDELTLTVANEEEILKSGLLKMIGKEIEDEYIKAVKTITVDQDMLKRNAKDVKIVFTPLHGTANKLVRRGLDEIGFKQVEVVKEQENPDPNFPTVTSPNPEEHAAFELAIKYGEEMDADILIGTDPDADRVGVVVKNKEGKYVVLTGNQTGALILDYLLTAKKDIPVNGVVIKTIVTSEIGRIIAESKGLKTLNTLTGFKYIGEKIKEFEETNEYSFLFGYEESYGYLVGDFVRDKDAVQACLIIAEVAAYYKEMGKSLYDGLQLLYEKVGYFQEDLQSFTLKGKDGLEKIELLMEVFRGLKEFTVDGMKVVVKEDYKQSEKIYFDGKNNERIHLPKSNVLKFILSDESWFCIRPSGTEPKIKFYFGIQSVSNQSAKTKLQKIKEKVMNIINDFI